MDNSCVFLEYWHALQGCRTTLIGRKIKEGVGHDFLGKENPYSAYGHAHNSRGRTVINYGRIFQGIGMFFKAFVLLDFLYSLGRISGTNSEDSLYSIYCWDSRTVYGFLGQKSRSFSGQLESEKLTSSCMNMYYFEYFHRDKNKTMKDRYDTIVRFPRNLLGKPLMNR